ncbi:MAG: hypothetical protein ACJ73S_01510 [Mycobacteriales bacterium]
MILPEVGPLWQFHVAERRRQPDVDDGGVGPVLVNRGEEGVGGGRDGRDLVLLAGQQQLEPGGQQDVVLGDHHPHGTSTVTAVGPPAGLVTSIVPSSARARRRMPSRPVPAASLAPRHRRR